MEVVSQKIDPDTFFHLFAQTGQRNPFAQVDQKFTEKADAAAGAVQAKVKKAKVEIQKFKNLEDL